MLLILFFPLALYDAFVKTIGFQSNSFNTVARIYFGAMKIWSLKLAEHVSTDSWARRCSCYIGWQILTNDQATIWIAPYLQLVLLTKGH